MATFEIELLAESLHKGRPKDEEPHVKRVPIKKENDSGIEYIVRIDLVIKNEKNERWRHVNCWPFRRSSELWKMKLRSSRLYLGWTILSTSYKNLFQFNLSYSTAIKMVFWTWRNFMELLGVSDFILTLSRSLVTITDKLVNCQARVPNWFLAFRLTCNFFYFVDWTKCWACHYRTQVYFFINLILFEQWTGLWGSEDCVCWQHWSLSLV